VRWGSRPPCLRGGRDGGAPGAQDPRRSRLKRMVPDVGSFFTPLALTDAFREYDEFFALSRRRYVPPKFAELRHVLNIAQAGPPPPDSLHACRGCRCGCGGLACHVCAEPLVPPTWSDQ